jgi:hypothetical protein
MDDDDDDQLGDIAKLRLQYRKVMLAETFLCSTRLLAALLRENPYITVSKYFDLVPDSDLQALIDIIECYKADVDRVGEDAASMSGLEEVLVLSEMLSTAEGVKSESLDDVQANLNAMAGFIICESLSRKQLATVVRANMSFDPQYRHLTIIKAR